MSASSIYAIGDTRVGRYDFGRTEVMDRARIRRLQPVFETMVHRIGGSLTTILRQPVQMEVTGLEQLPWKEYAGSLPDPTFLASAAVIPLEGRFLMHLSAATSLHVLDVYLGGDGASVPDRPVLTEIEGYLMGTIVEDLVQAIPPAFGAIIELGLGVVQKFNSPIYVQPGRTEETCLIVEMAMAVAENDPRKLDLCIPMSAFLPIVEAFERLQHGTEEHAPSSAAGRRLLDVHVELQVAYPPVSLTTSELLGLRVGDVIPLGTDAAGDAQFELLAEGVPFGRGMLVENGRRLACTVTSRRVDGQ